MGTIHRMEEAREPDEEFPPPAERPKVVPVKPAKMVGRGGVQMRMGIRSPDYGEGTVVNLTAGGVQVHWVKALTGTSTHLLEHQIAFVEQCERLE